MRRMIAPETIIKSQIIDDKAQVDLNEILEKYGTDIGFGAKTITLQIYNKYASDENQNAMYNDSDIFVYVAVNGSITISKYDDFRVTIQGMLVDGSYVLKKYAEIQSGSYENGIILSSSNEFDLYVIRV